MRRKFKPRLKDYSVNTVLETCENSDFKRTLPAVSFAKFGYIKRIYALTSQWISKGSNLCTYDAENSASSVSTDVDPQGNSEELSFSTRTIDLINWIWFCSLGLHTVPIFMVSDTNSVNAS